MAHFAQLDENNKVIQVIVVGNDHLYDPFLQGESELAGIHFCKQLCGEDTVWKQTSYNSNFRYNYAGIDSTYDPDNDAFIPPKPYDSWVINTETFRWEAPIPAPDDSGTHNWDEDTQTWVSIYQ